MKQILYDHETGCKKVDWVANWGTEDLLQHVKMLSPPLPLLSPPPSSKDVSVCTTHPFLKLGLWSQESHNRTKPTFITSYYIYKVTWNSARAVCQSNICQSSCQSNTTHQLSCRLYYGIVWLDWSYNSLFLTSELHKPALQGYVPLTWYK